MMTSRHRIDVEDDDLVTDLLTLCDDGCDGLPGPQTVFEISWVKAVGRVEKTSP